MSSNKDTALEIKQIFDENELSDLKRFMNKRACLNCTNQYMSYLFHLVQSAGILTTTIAAGYDQKYLVLIGVGLNFLASLITIYEKTNDSILKKLIIDIKTIKDGNYVDEGALIDVDINKNNGDNNDDNEINKKVANSLLKKPLL